MRRRRVTVLWKATREQGCGERVKDGTATSAAERQFSDATLARRGRDWDMAMALCWGGFGFVPKQMHCSAACLLLRCCCCFTCQV